MRDLLEYLPYRLVASIIRLLPWTACTVLGRFLGTVAFDVLHIRRQLTLDNLSRAFPEMSREECAKVGREAMENVCISLLETFWFPRLNSQRVDAIVEAEGIGLMEEKLRAGKGLIMMSGHFGNWELIALSVGMLSRKALTIVVQEQRNKLVDRFMTRTRTRFGNSVIVMDQSPRVLLRTLHENGVVAMLADQSAPRESIFIDFFDRPAATHRGPALISLRTGAPIVMAYLVRTAPGRYRIEFEPLDMTLPEGADDEEKIRILSERHVRALEAMVRAHPGHWLWLHKRWKHERFAPTLTAERVQ